MTPMIHLRMQEEEPKKEEPENEPGSEPKKEEPESEPKKEEPENAPESEPKEKRKEKRNNWYYQFCIDVKRKSVKT